MKVFTECGAALGHKCGDDMTAECQRVRIWMV